MAKLAPEAFDLVINDEVGDLGGASASTASDAAFVTVEMESVGNF